MNHIEYDQIANIKVFGIGGGGNNAVNHMHEENLQGVELFVANTDLQDLNASPVTNKIRLGNLGAGSDPAIGRNSALEHESEIRAAMEGADMVYITAGLGGGTGTGAAPVFAKIAKDLGALTVGIVTTPFKLEGRRRERQAAEGLAELSKVVDSLIIVSNNRLMEMTGDIDLVDSFKEADLVLTQGVRIVTDLIAVPSLINLDFADVKNVMENKGKALIGIGEGTGENAAIDAAKQAVESPLLETQLIGAQKAIVNVTGGRDLTLTDAQNAISYIQEYSGDELDVILGVMINENLSNTIIITIIATGFEEEEVVVPQNSVIRKKKEETVTEVFEDEDVFVPDFFKNRN